MKEPTRYFSLCSKQHLYFCVTNFCSRGITSQLTFTKMLCGLPPHRVEVTRSEAAIVIAAHRLGGEEAAVAALRDVVNKRAPSGEGSRGGVRLP